MILKKIYAAFLFALLIIPGCTTSPAVVVKAVAGNQSVTAKTGKPFSVQLQSQLSTGYSWKLFDAPAALVIVKEDVVSEQKNPAVAGGYEIQEFTFKSAAKGEFTLTFKYGQHWKNNPDYPRTATVRVKIE